MISKHSSIALIASAAALLGIVTVGCGAKDTSDSADNGADLATNEAQLVDDDSESAGTDDDLESGVDEPLSGSTVLDPGTPAMDGATDDDVFEKIRANAGNFFKPAGCIESTRVANVITHKFTSCTGPWSLVNFNGTITSTWTRTATSLTVVHAATGFTANGASISGSRQIVYTRAGSVITKTRTGTWSGTTAKGKDITHDANFVTTYDSSTKCLTRDGSAQSTIGGRSFERTIDNYKRCGIGRLGCPESGKLTLSKTKSSDTLTLTIDFLGGVKFEVTRPNGRVVDRVLICNPNAT